MKIGVTGTHGTGKTTYAMNLVHQYKMEHPDKKVYLLQENILDCPFPVNKGGIVESQFWITSNTVQRELEASLKFDIIVCDRTIIDPIPYTYGVGLDIFATAMYEYYKHFLRSYDEIHQLHASREFIFNDGIRDIDYDYRLEIDKRFCNMLDSYEKSGYIEKLVHVWE